MSRHRNMQGYVDEYYDDYDDYGDDDYGYNESGGYSTPVTKKAPAPKKQVQPKPKSTPKNSNNKQASKSKSKDLADKVKNVKIEVKIEKQASIPKVQLVSLDDIQKTIKTKPTLNLVIIGHVDSGKSTLTGHLLVKCGLVNNQELHKLSKAADLVNKSSFKFAFVMDDDEVEREHGVTINCSKRTFTTPKYKVNLADAPGHRDFVPNMISGAANADAAVLVIDGRPGEFESGFSENGQTREHAIIARSLGVTQLVVAINKMDAVNWEKQRFEQISTILKQFLTKSGFNKKNLHFVGVSGISGDNLDERHPSQAASLIDCIDKLNVPDRKIDKRSRIAITEISQVSESKLSCLARVETGSIQVNEIFHFQPNFESLDFLVQIAGVYRDDEENDESESIAPQYALAGETIGIDLKPINQKFENVFSSGTWLSQHNHPMQVGDKFRAKFLILGGDAQTYDNVDVPPITKGFNITLHLGLCEVPGKITRLGQLMDKKTGKPIDGKVRVLTKGQAAFITITTQRMICCDLTDSISTRFTVRVQGITVGSGQIEAFIYK